MKALLLLNGQPPAALPDGNNYQLFCVTDGAYSKAKILAREPDLLVGDFDSISLSELAAFQGETVSLPNQEHTDYYKALDLLCQRGFTTIDVYGATGNNSDHFLDNLSACLHWKNRLKITLYDDCGRYFFSERHTIINDILNCSVSLMPFFEVDGITTSGLEYALNNEKLLFGNRMGTRNTAVENKVAIDYKQGELLIFISHSSFPRR